MTTAKTVWVLDDDEAVRDSLDAILTASGHPTRVFGTAAEFLAACAAETPGCLLLDVRMPEISGLTLLERLRAECADFPVILVTGHGDVQMAVRAMRDGASDFIEKPFTKELILESVARALGAPERNAAAKPRARAARPAAAEPPASGIERLTPRERDVLEQLVTGHPNKVIAYNLNISPRTVEVHRARVMEKLGARSLSQLVRQAIAAGIDPEDG